MKMNESDELIPLLTIFANVTADLIGAITHEEASLEDAEAIIAMVADTYGAKLEIDPDKLLESAKYRLVQLPPVEELE